MGHLALFSVPCTAEAADGSSFPEAGREQGWESRSSRMGRLVGRRPPIASWFLLAGRLLILDWPENKKGVCTSWGRGCAVPEYIQSDFKPIYIYSRIFLL